MDARLFIRRIRDFVYRSISTGALPFAKMLGVTVRPVGFFECVEKWSVGKQRYEGEEYHEYEPPQIQDYSVEERLLSSDLGECFRKLAAANTTRQFRLLLRDARTYGRRGVVVHQSNKIFSEITFEFATAPRLFKFWNTLRVPDVSRQVKRLGVAHSISSQNYSHWVMEVVPQLIQLKEDLDAGRIDFICVDCEKGFQREWLDMVGIAEEKVILSKDNLHIQAEQMVVYSMPMRNGEFTQTQYQLFRSLVKGRWKKVPGKKLFVGREGGARPFSLSDADVRTVVEDCGYGYVLMEQHPVEEKLQYFTEAEVVAGPHGAGLGGILFTDSCAEFREIHSPLIPNLCYWRIAHQRGLRYSNLFGEVQKGELKGVYSGVQLSESQLRTFLLDEII